MPYIKQEDKTRFLPLTNLVETTSVDTPGQLNFLLTKIVRAYIIQHGLNYQHINDVVGALEGAKLEFYRRLAAPYEDGKIKENGDVGYEQFDPTYLRDPKFHR